ncbi:MAG TPA: SDR family NAD(P)-dependent oxidoreductase, partial [Pyrinomonadaceae bacterium]|nr:SDR family NAD(P)-dependent oxidoreductase [Pyrinomonadaceae bacterium]
MDLKDSAAIVTGGTKGIGFAIAETLLKNGASVLVCGRSRADVQNAAEKLLPMGKVEAVSCDVRNEDHVKMMFEH